jgi:hypothetical protein
MELDALTATWPEELRAERDRFRFVACLFTYKRFALAEATT